MYIEIHPAIVHFPIAFITLAYFFQLLSIIIPSKLPKHLNLWVLIPAALSTLPAVLSGQSAKNKLTELDQTLEDADSFGLDLEKVQKEIEATASI